mgnify:CR=1 FL=1
MGNKLYVGNLAYSVRDESLQQAFGQFGSVTGLVLLPSVLPWFAEYKDHVAVLGSPQVSGPLTLNVAASPVIPWPSCSIASASVPP